MDLMQKDKNRIHFIDYLRGFMVLLVVFDHSMHAYTTYFKTGWYIPEFGGKLIFDLWHMQNDVIMMPMLFFLAGMFVLPSLERRGFKSFITEKFFRLFVPMVLGIIILVPPQVYYGKIATEKIPETTAYWDWIQNQFFGEHLWSSAFWFLLTLLILTFVLVGLDYLFPKFKVGLGNLAKWIVSNPFKGVLALCLYAVVVIGFCEFYFGRFDFAMKNYLGWIGQLMKVRQSRFIMEFSFFFMGAGFAQAGLTRSKEKLSAIGDSWKLWTVFALVSGAAYMYYSLENFYDGAYNLEILRHFYSGGSWADVLPMVIPYGGPILIRTTLMGLFMIAIAGFYMAIFQHFLDKPSEKWQSLAVCSFGIYIFHETIVVPIHFWFLDTDYSHYTKFAVTAFAAISISWILTALLRNLPGFKRVL